MTGPAGGRDVILVTGATGKVGRNVVAQLLEAGAAVRALARDPVRRGCPPRPRWFPATCPVRRRCRPL